LGLLLGGVGDDDAGSGGGLGLVGLDDDAVAQRPDSSLAHLVSPHVSVAVNRHDGTGLVVAGAEAPARGYWHSRCESAKPMLTLGNRGVRVLRRTEIHA